MTIAYWCVFVAGLLPFVWTSTAKGIGGGFKRAEHNHNPREFLESLGGIAKRAHWAQLNSFEAFPLFAAAVIIAQLAGGAQPRIDMLAMAYIVTRVLHGVFYLTDKAALRSLVWFASMGCVIALFIAGA
jgi:uncharacterized MAPEG superfamily protein